MEQKGRLKHLKWLFLSILERNTSALKVVQSWITSGIAEDAEEIVYLSSLEYSLKEIGDILAEIAMSTDVREAVLTKKPSFKEMQKICKPFGILVEESLAEGYIVAALEESTIRNALEPLGFSVSGIGMLRDNKRNLSFLYAHKKWHKEA